MGKATTEAKPAKAEATKKMTFKDMNRFSEVFKGTIQRKEKFMETKLGYAAKRFEEINLIPLYKEYNNELAMVRIDHALTNKETDALMLGAPPRGFQYDKAGMKKVMAAELKIQSDWENREFEVKPYICKKENLPTDLTEEEKEVYDGLIM